MLRSLRIRNLALLEEVELEFEEGFTAVTGETGAGKSILLGALSLLAGERADKSVVRQGAAACEVEAALHFARPERIDALLEALDLPACEDGVLLLKRSVGIDRPGKISVNGGLATLTALQRLGEAWIDFHGPSEPRRLLKESCQLELLDLYGRTGEELAAYRAAYGGWRQAQADRERLAAEARLSPDQVEFLKHQLRQFDAVDLSDEAIEALERDFQRMARSQELIELASGLAGGLGGEDGVQGKVAALLKEARRLAELDGASRGLAERLAAAAAELHELEAEFSALVESLRFDSAAAEELTRRMNAWLELKRRHGLDPAEVRAARDGLARRLEGQADFAGKMKELAARLAAAEQAARERARALRGKREKAARALAAAARKEIAGLGFAKAGFDVRLTSPGAGPAPSPGLERVGGASGAMPGAQRTAFGGGGSGAGGSTDFQREAAAAGRPGDTALGPNGDCGAEFRFSPNVGEEPRPLARIASSGELARVMLALKSILAELDDVPVLVFDEVDANVGGEIGRVVGEKMAVIGRSRQVLCVTHLPQVAAQAASHFVVAKEQGKDRAVVSIRAIQGERKARVSELARMLGDHRARSALAHAEELLAAAKPAPARPGGARVPL